MQKFDVQGMSCDHCVRAIEDAIHLVDADAEVAVDLAAKTVSVSNESAPEAVLLDAITREGYEATPLL